MVERRAVAARGFRRKGREQFVKVYPLKVIITIYAFWVGMEWYSLVTVPFLVWVAVTIDFGSSG
jgi:hypothetical protein